MHKNIFLFCAKYILKMVKIFVIIINVKRLKKFFLKKIFSRNFKKTLDKLITL